MQQVELEIVNQYFEDNGGSLDGWTIVTGNPSTRNYPDAANYTPGTVVYFPGAQATTHIYQDVILPNDSLSISLIWWQASYEGKDQSAVGVQFFDQNNNAIDNPVMADMIAIPGNNTFQPRSLEDIDIPSEAKIARIIIRSVRKQGGDSNGYIAGVEATVIAEDAIDTERKFTPYGLTALPPKAERDPNGVYFIRTATGFELVTINKITREPVRMDKVSYPTGVPTDINELKTGLPAVWTPQGLRESMFNLFKIVIVDLPTYDGIDIVRSNLQTSFIIETGNNATISLPDAGKVEGHIVRIVAGRAGGLQNVSIDQPYKYFDGSTIPGTSLAGDYMLLQSNEKYWYMIGGN